MFRFISEGSVEEKIIERADRKLFLDAAVIQQGRLAEQHSSLEKEELMRMVKFGADQIISGKGGTYTDEDIDALIAKGEEKTSAIQAKLKTDAQHNLANFSLLAEDETGMDTFDFGGKNYRGDSKNTGNFINLPQRERKRNYDVDGYFRETMHAGSGLKAHEKDAAAKKRRKGPALHDYQLFDKERIDAIAEFERTMGAKKEEHLEKIRNMRLKAVDAPSAGPGVPEEQSKEFLFKTADEMESQLVHFELTKEQRDEKEQLLAEGFPDWSRKDFKAFCSSLERHGRYDVDSVVEDVTTECGKDAQDVKRYFVMFWSNYRRISGYEKIVGNIEKGEKKILRLRQIRDAIQEKVERHLEDTFGPHFWDPERGEQRRKDLPSATELMHYSWPRMKISYGTGYRGRSYQEEEDAFLIWYVRGTCVSTLECYVC